MKRIGLSILVLTLCLGFNSAVNAQGVWTPLSNPNPAGGCGTLMLLTDGSVLVFSGTTIIGQSAVCTKLTPDASGNYVNGTWTTVAPMATARFAFASNILPNGKVFVMGGEYSSAGRFTNLGEIYDPVSNTWSAVGKFPQSDFGDDPTVLLPNGKVLCGYIGDGVPTGGPLDGLTYLYDPATNQFTQTGTKLLQDQSDEETWSLLPDGSVLSYNIFASPAAGAGSAQRYIPATGKWVATGPVPVPLSNLINDGVTGGLGAELGPMLLLPDGRMFLIGANNNTVFYTPSTDSWTQGPSLPTNYGCDDAPAAMLPNGKVIFFADNSLPIDFTPPTHAFLFDPTANTITNITPTGTLGTIMANSIAQQFCMLMLPNGHMLLSTENSTLWDFAPTGSPNSSWAPTITKVANVSGNNYTLTGTQLTGISEGSSFGDDLENSTNYPIVRLRSSSGAVTYGRTTNWTPGVATGSLQTSVNFTIPASLGIGTYSVSVIANGIASASQSVFIGGVPSNVVASYSGGTLSITGASATDNNSHNLTVSEVAGKIKIQGANGTKINNQASYSVAVSGNWKLSVNFAGGDDSIAFIGVNQLPNANIQLGAGNDKASFTLCSIGTLTINGGTGTNTFLQSSSKITKLIETNFTK